MLAHRLVKICGNTFVEDSLRVAAHEPDLMGWVFSLRSARRIPVERAARLLPAIGAAHPRIYHVGVFADNSVGEILDIVRRVPTLDYLQIVGDSGLFHAVRTALTRAGAAWSAGLADEDGAPDLEFARTLSLPVVIPALRVRERLRSLDLVRYGQVPFRVLDSYVADQPGGTGQRLALDLVAEVQAPYLLAGGLRAETVGAALRESGALGADVSSGVELPGQPGRKDPDLVAAFVRAVRAV